MTTRPGPLVRDDDAAADLAGIIASTERMASHYLTEFDGAEELQGSITSADKQAFAYSVASTDAQAAPRGATLSGALPDGGRQVTPSDLSLLNQKEGPSRCWDPPKEIQAVERLLDDLGDTT